MRHTGLQEERSPEDREDAGVRETGTSGSEKKQDRTLEDFWECVVLPLDIIHC